MRWPHKFAWQIYIAMGVSQFFLSLRCFAYCLSGTAIAIGSSVDPLRVEASKCVRTEARRPKRRLWTHTKTLSVVLEHGEQRPCRLFPRKTYASLLYWSSILGGMHLVDDKYEREP